MTYYQWYYHNRHKAIEIKPTTRVWLRPVPVRMIDLPVSVWLRLKNMPIEPKTAVQVLSIFMGAKRWQVMTMDAGRVIALLNHVKAQVEKCNNIWKNIHGVLLEINDGLNRSHWEGLHDLAIIHDLAQGDILKAEAVEKMTFATVVNWKKIQLAQIRDEQNKYVKQKNELKTKKR